MPLPIRTERVLGAGVLSAEHSRRFFLIRNAPGEASGLGGAPARKNFGVVGGVPVDPERPGGLEGVPFGRFARKSAKSRGSRGCTHRPRPISRGS